MEWKILFSICWCILSPWFADPDALGGAKYIKLREPDELSKYSTLKEVSGENSSFDEKVDELAKEIQNQTVQAVNGEGLKTDDEISGNAFAVDVDEVPGNFSNNVCTVIALNWHLI